MVPPMDPVLIKKKLEYEERKARAKALALRLKCTICGDKAKLNCPCGTTQCDPGAVNGERCACAARRVRRRATRSGAQSRATRQVLLDRLPTHRLARPRPPEGVQEDPRRARGGGGAGGSPDAHARGGLRPRAAVSRRRNPRSHRRGTRGGPRAARGEPGAGASVGAVGVEMPGLLRVLGRECDVFTSRLLLPDDLPVVHAQGYG